MSTKLLFLALALVPSCAPLMAQTAPASRNSYAARGASASIEPFSRVAVSGGISLMGINMQAAVNAGRHLNVRSTGSFFSYTASNIDVSNFAAQGKVNFATGGASLDYYPFPSHGFRLSPGALFYNQNRITASAVGAAGSDITLNSVKYYSETANPIGMNAVLGLNARKQAFTMTTGWGNMIPRKGGHLSFPFEIGAAFTGVPTIDMGLSGYGCTNASDAPISGSSCVNMAANTTAQTNLNGQLTKWTKDLNDLQVYPIFSFGMSYAFKIRR